ISMAILQPPADEGGHNLLDLKAQNEAIELMKLRTYTEPDPLWHAPWTRLADHTLALAAKAEVRRWIGHRQCHNFLLQDLDIYKNSKTLPKSLQCMLQAAKLHEAKFAPTEITLHMKLAMPFWYHLAR
ncbi:hypothetical protein BDQ17DRAFT_1181091, partial [Cyathus striatus]